MEVTQRKLVQAYSFLNDLLFIGTLTRPRITVGLLPADCDLPANTLGFFNWEDDSPRETYIHVNLKAHDSVDDVLGTLAHEMIHQAQHMLGLEIDHGDFFQGYADACRDRLEIDV